MKRTVALVLLLCLLATLVLPALATETGDQDMLETLRALEIMVGDEKGELNLTAPVTRSAFAKLLVASSGDREALGGEGAGYSLFTDVKSSHWASEYIKLCLDRGWMIGYTDGAFRPDNTVTLEEACTAALRLLGFDGSNLSGSFPMAQLNKASAVGLRDGLDAVRGQELTRGDCARLFYNLLTAKTAQGQIYALTLGYTLDSDGEVDYMAALKEDLAGPYLYAGAVDSLPATPRVTYLNDKRVSGLSWQKDDVYYYSGGYLWVYRDTAYGQITALLPGASNPSSVTVNNKNYSIGSDEAREQLSALGSHAVGTTVTLLLGMDGEVAAAQTVNGPFVAQSDTALDFVPQTVYRDGERWDSARLERYDVYYYSAGSKTLWIYTDQVTGRIEALSPSALNPTAVTISGQSYPLADDQLSRRLSTLNGKWTDQTVTLLFGMDGAVVEVLTDDDVAATYYGVVRSAAKVVVDGKVEQQVTLMCTDGRLHTVSTGANVTWEAGDLAQARIDQNGTALSSLRGTSISGRVDSEGTSVGSYRLSRSVQVLDTDEEGNAAAVERSELAGLDLSSGNVRYYALDPNGEVEHLILQNATGSLWRYGYLADLEEQGTGALSFSSQYTLLLEGQTRTFSSNNKGYPVSKGQGVAVRLAANGSVSAMQPLQSVALSSLGKTTATASNGQSYTLADKVWVYVAGAKQEYYPAQLEDARTGDHTLTGYYDAAQKQLRVIIAR